MAVSPEDVNCLAALLAFGWGELDPEVNREEELINFMINAGYVKDSNAAKKENRKNDVLNGREENFLQGFNHGSSS